MYYDLNVPWNEESQSRIPQLIKLYQKFGYGAIVFNHTVTAKLPKSKCSIQRHQEVDEAKSSKKQGIRQYTRLTLILDNPQQNYGINSSNEIIKSYDVIAIQPTTEKMFQVACSTLEIDLITFDFSSSKPAFFPIKHGYVRQALDRGIHFEIVYSPSILDPSRRKQAIMTAQTLCRVTKGKNVIFTSGADSEWLLRAPADAMNLAGIFGIPAHHRKQSIADTQRKLIEHAASRKLTYRTAVATVPEAILDGLKAPDNDLQEDFIRF